MSVNEIMNAITCVVLLSFAFFAIFAVMSSAQEQLITDPLTTFSQDSVIVDALVDRKGEIPQTNAEIISGGPDRNAFVEWLQGIIGITTTTTEPPPPVLTPPTNCAKCSCGIANKQNRIVGGQETEVNQYPWMALLLYGSTFYCGATLINDRYVLTAAHCVQGFDKSKISVRLLEHNRSSDSETKTITKKVLRIVRHSGYSASNYNNDIALIQFDSPVSIEALLRPACLPTPGKSFTGYNATVTGWGALQEQGSISNTLQEVSVPIMSNADCKKTGYGAKRITDNMMCAGYPQGMKDSCQGDSGGPLVVGESSTFQIVGVVSWGEGCAQPNYPGVYSRVNRYGTWIRTNTQDACYCFSNMKLK